MTAVAISLPIGFAKYELPWPPSLNRAYRAVGGGVLLSEAGRSYTKQVVNALPKGQIVPLRGRLRVYASLAPPRSMGVRRWDIMNREKILCDSLTKARVWLDDSQIDYFAMERLPPAGAGYVFMQIWEHES